MATFSVPARRPSSCEFEFYNDVKKLEKKTLKISPVRLPGRGAVGLPPRGGRGRRYEGRKTSEKSQKPLQFTIQLVSEYFLCHLVTHYGQEVHLELPHVHLLLLADDLGSVRVEEDSARRNFPVMSKCIYHILFDKFITST